MGTLAELLIEIGLETKEIAKDAGEVDGKLKKTWAGIGKAAAIGGAAAGAALMAGIDQVIEQSKPMALLSAQLGAGSPIAAQAGKAAGAVYAKGVVGSMEDATDAVKTAVQNALVPPDASSGAIANVASQITNLATTMGEDSSKVGVAISQMLRTGVARSSTEAFDILQSGVQNGVNKADDLLDTFNEYPTQFRKLGLSGQTAMGLLSQGLKGGARDSDLVADALKEFSIRAIDGSTTTAQGFKELGLSGKLMGKNVARGGDYANEALTITLDKLRGIKDPVKRSAAAVKLFGTQAEDLGSALYDLNPDTAAKSLGKVAGAAKVAGDALEQSAGAKLESFKRQAQEALVTQLAKAIPYITATFGWLSKNSSWVTPLATALGILAAAIGIVVAVQWAWNAALALSPVTWIIIGIVALIAVIVLVATKTRFFQTIWAGVWGFLKGVGAWFAGPFANFFKAAYRMFIDGAMQAWHGIVAAWNGVKSATSAVKNALGAAVNWVVSKWRGMVSALVSAKNKVSSSLSGMWNGMKNGFRSAINYVIGKWNSLHFSIPSFSILGKSFGGGSIGVPNIPYMADGGIATGPTLAMIGEGGEDEAVIPLSKLPDVAGSQRQGATTVQIVPGGEAEFRRWIKKSIRVKGPIQETKAA